MQQNIEKRLPPMYEKILAHETMKYRNASNLCCGRRGLKKRCRQWRYVV